MDNYFDGTLDDFLDDHDLLALASRALPLESPSPPRFLDAAPMRPYAHEARQMSGSGVRRGIGELPLHSNPGRLRGAPTLSSDFLGALWPGPTRPGPSYRSTPAASPHADYSRLTTAPRTQENPSPLASQTSSPLHSASARPSLHALLNSSPGTFLPFHGLPTYSAGSFPRHRGRIAISPSEGQPRDTPHVSLQRRRPHQFQADEAAAAASYGHAPGFPPHHTDSSTLASPTMSSRRRSLRPGDLSLPSASSQARPPSRSTSANPRRSTSRQLQPEQASSSSKRKREAGDDEDLFGDDPFAGAEVIDLVDKTEVPAEILNSQEKSKNHVRLSTFDCVICMDSVKDLTVTHCGHLFCSACLHSALNMDQARRICPICRTKIDRPPPATGKFGPKAKGFYPLELKLMTRKTLGRTSDQSSQGARD